MAFNWRPLMGRITAAFRQELGENLTGIYLHGSAAFGSMSEGSDLDFIAVTERPPTQEQKEHLIAALLQLEREAPAKGLEMSVVLLRDCRDFAYPTPYQLHYSPMHRRAFEQDLAGYCRRMQGVDYDLAAHFTVIRRVGIVLFGSLIREVFGPVPFADYLDSICRDVAGAAQDILHTPLDTALNLCRKREKGCKTSPSLMSPSGPSARITAAHKSGRVRFGSRQNRQHRAISHKKKSASAASWPFCQKTMTSIAAHRKMP